MCFFTTPNVVKTYLQGCSWNGKIIILNYNLEKRLNNSRNLVIMDTISRYIVLINQKLKTLSLS